MIDFVWLRRAEDAHRAQTHDDRLGGILGRANGRVDPDLWVFRRLVGGIDSGEVLEVAAPCFLIESLRIPALGHAERRVDKYLAELAFFHQVPRQSPFRPEG